MELQPPNLIEFTSATNDLISDVEKLAEKVNEFRPMNSELVDAVHLKLFAERVYFSNAIEGNTLTLRETTEILNTGYISQRRRREGTEARNLGEAVQYLEKTLLPAANPYAVSQLLELHAILLRDIETSAGIFRDDRRMIAGAKYQPPRPELVPQLTEDIIKQINLNEKLPAVKLATWAHWALARVHPFTDGNGRMARLWQDLILLKAHLAPAIIRLQDRDQNGYYDALASADDGDLNPLTQLIAQRAAATLEQYISAQQQAAELGTWASKIAGELGVRTAEQRKAKYLRWSRLMESLRNDFQRCAAKITSSGIEVQFREYPIIDEVAWDNIRNGIGARQTWFFTLLFRQQGRFLKYIFFFGKHYWSVEDTELERREPRVALLVSEQDGPVDAKMLNDVADCALELRQIFLVDTDLVAVKSSAGAELRYDRGAKGLDLARDFIEQVILRRLS